MPEIRTTLMALSVHDEGDNPIFGESAIHVSLDDEAGGAFIVIHEIATDQKIRIDLEQLELVVVEARKLIQGAAP